MDEATHDPAKAAATRSLRAPGRSAMTLDRPRIMGILNVTPDSFSDGGNYAQIDAAVERALAMAAEGADLIDVGGESSRPGAQRIDEAEQCRRVVDVIRQTRQRLDAAGHERVWISIDTTRSAVARAALGAGASMLNDISGGREDPAILSVAAEHGVPICLMHMKGQPATMQQAPAYDDVVGEVLAHLAQRVEAAVAAGVEASQVVIDPGIGFGKTFEHNMALMRGLAKLATTGQPVLLGASRKRFLCRALGLDTTVEPAPHGGSAAATVWGVAQGVALIRVHDVALSRQAADVALNFKATPREGR